VSDEPQGLYEKYRVFREPQDVDEHPVKMWAYCRYKAAMKDGRIIDIRADVYEVKEFTFVLKPDSDPHAVTAIGAYALAIRDQDPQLATDLLRIMEQYR
jgi:hypothetical protein